MNKSNTNLLVAIVFIVTFLFFWDAFVMKRYRIPPSQPASQSQKGNTESNEQAKLSALADKVIETPDLGKPAKDALTVLTTPHTQVTFNSQGARVLSWKILEKDHWLELVVPEKSRIVSPLETFRDLNYSVNHVKDDRATFTAQRPDGLVITKSVVLSSQSPFHSVSVRFSNKSSEPLPLNTFFGWGNGIDKHPVNAPYSSKDEIMAEQQAVAFDGQVKRWKSGFVFNRSVNLEQTGAFDWIGVDNHHFLAALIAPATKILSVKVTADRTIPPLAAAAIHTNLEPGATLEQNYLMYVGPKNYEAMKTMGYNLNKAVDFGFFGFISKTLLFTLNKFERWTGNYGWAIILLTFLIQLVVFPLTIKNFKHSIRMKELQPQLKKLQEQFKSDPKRLQVETFNLYRKSGMKFMGMEGCFPILLQIPIFFAFYSTLNVAYELRGAPWILWVKDLGAHDPYYVLPIIMGLGMFLQQKLSSVAMDPAQARMMLFMPIMFTFMFLKLPAGLVLYWCVNSLTTIAVQLFMQRRAVSHAPR